MHILPKDMKSPFPIAHHDLSFSSIVSQSLTASYNIVFNVAFGTPCTFLVCSLLATIIPHPLAKEYRRIPHPPFVS